MTKDEIRLKLREQRDRLTFQEQQVFNEKISNQLLRLNAFQESNMIFPYLSFRSEVDTRKIIQRSLQEKKSIYLPRVDKKDMDFYEVSNLEGLILSRYGILEPPKDDSKCYREPSVKGNTEYEEKVPVSQLIKGALNNNQYLRLILLPGLAFDRKGNRIGYGAGYYDRYLTRFSEEHFYKIALAYDIQVIDEIPSDDYDVKADAILTPTGLILCKNT